MICNKCGSTLSYVGQAHKCYPLEPRGSHFSTGRIIEGVHNVETWGAAISAEMAQLENTVEERAKEV